MHRRTRRSRGSRPAGETRHVIVQQQEETDPNEFTVRSILGELIGSIFLTFAIVATRGNANLTGTPEGGLVGVALVHALVLASLAAAVGPYSMGHFNPAVTLAFVTTGQQKLSIGCAYWILQFMGGIFGGLIAAAIVPGGVEWGAPLLGTGATVGQAFGAEFMGTFFLVFIILLAAVTGHNKAGAFIAIGFALGVGVLFAGPISNACLNPQRALGGAIAAGGTHDWTPFWVYMIAPLAGAFVAGLFFTFVFQQEDDESLGDGSRLTIRK
jgi:aquaporin Z